jgi:dUTP pyrophosphatase
MEIKIQKLYEDAEVPTYGSALSAGMDLYAHLGEHEMLLIKPHETIKVGTGIAVEPPVGYFGAVFARSGLATKQGLRPANCVGVCDWDYRGEYIVALHNDSEEEREVRNGDRIAQLVFLPYITGEIKVVDELSNTERGDGGFGSTGK